MMNENNIDEIIDIFKFNQCPLCLFHTVSVYPSPENELNYLTIANNGNTILYDASYSTDGSLNVFPKQIPNSLVTDGDVNVLTLKNNSCHDEARIVIGNTFTGHPECDGEYTAIGGQYVNDKLHGKMNFYIRDNRI